MVPTDNETTPNLLVNNYEKFNNQIEKSWILYNDHQNNINEYQTKCDKPQLAHNVYLRLMTIAQKTNPNQYSANEILISAYTGCNLTYRNASEENVTKQ